MAALWVVHVTQLDVQTSVMETATTHDGCLHQEQKQTHSHQHPSERADSSLDYLNPVVHRTTWLRARLNLPDTRGVLGHRGHRGKQWTHHWAAGLSGTVRWHHLVVQLHGVTDRLYWTLLSYGHHGTWQGHRVYVREIDRWVCYWPANVLLCHLTMVFYEQICVTRQKYKHSDYVHKLQCHMSIFIRQKAEII